MDRLLSMRGAWPRGSIAWLGCLARARGRDPLSTDLDPSSSRSVILSQGQLEQSSEIGRRGAVVGCEDLGVGRRARLRGRGDAETCEGSKREQTDQDERVE